MMTYLKFKEKKKLLSLNLKVNALKNYPTINKLKLAFKWFAGRNNRGRIVFNSKASKRCFKTFRIVDFDYSIMNLFSIVLRNEYDPNRTSLVSLVCYSNGILSYIISLQNLLVNKIICNTNNVNLIKNFYAIPLQLSSEGMLINNVELRATQGGILSRSAGNFSVVLKKLFNKFILIKLPSKEQILVNNKCFGRIGKISNINNKYFRFYKAGQVKKLGFKPIVRGVAKNPIDHPHGGGGGKCQVTPWAKVAKNKSTRIKKINNSFIIRSRKLQKKKCRLLN